MTMKILRKTLVSVLFFMCICIGASAEAKEKTKIIGNVKYTYTNYDSNFIWIVEITPLTDQGISTLRIPSYLEGKKVVKLGNKYDNLSES